MADDNEIRQFWSETITSEGNLVQDLKDISGNQDGSAVVGRLAANSRNWRGEDVTFYRNFKIVGSQAKNAIGSVRKGDRVVVVGRIEGHWYLPKGVEDKDENYIADMTIVADKFAISTRFAATSVNRDDSRGETRSRRTAVEDDEPPRRERRRREEPEEPAAAEPRRRRRVEEPDAGPEARPSRRSRRAAVVNAGDDDEDYQD